MVVAFFGHRDASADIEPKIKEVVKDLIENQGADTFLVGNNGSFDAMVKKVLAEVEGLYPHVKYSVVLAYLPIQKRNTRTTHTQYFPRAWKRCRYALSYQSVTSL